MPFFDHECNECNFVWEDFFFVNEANPTACPSCGCEKEGCIKRLPSLVARGVVKLSGQEYKAKIFSDAKDITRQAATNENLRANLVGEDKYQSKEKVRDMIKKI